MCTTQLVMPRLCVGLQTHARTCCIRISAVQKNWQWSIIAKQNTPLRVYVCMWGGPRQNKNTVGKHWLAGSDTGFYYSKRLPLKFYSNSCSVCIRPVLLSSAQQPAKNPRRATVAPSQVSSTRHKAQKQSHCQKWWQRMQHNTMPIQIAGYFASHALVLVINSWQQRVWVHVG